MSGTEDKGGSVESAVGDGVDRDTAATESAAAELVDFFAARETVTVLGGAGCSTASGIPDYRDDVGNWKNDRPVLFADFVSSARVRQRYWARSFVGWNRISSARPNRAHIALAMLERAGRINCLITQNVDNLHRAAGSRNVIDLHGVLDRIRCLCCRRTTLRREFQARLEELNPDRNVEVRAFTPDGDAQLARDDVERFSVPGCSACGGILKPDVVFFGEAVPVDRVHRARAFLQRSDALLIVGSSLMVFSGLRFARMAYAHGKQIAIVNRGTTRADGIASLRLTGDCGQLLAAIAESFCFGGEKKGNEQ